MDLGETNVWTLEEDEPDATVDHICKFIVEYINSDVMVRPCYVLMSSRMVTCFVRIAGYASE
jgi:hypothetical protein